MKYTANNIILIANQSVDYTDCAIFHINISICLCCAHGMCHPTDTGCYTVNARHTFKSPPSMKYNSTDVYAFKCFILETLIIFLIHTTIFIFTGIHRTDSFIPTNTTSTALQRCACRLNSNGFCYCVYLYGCRNMLPWIYQCLQFIQ